MHMPQDTVGDPTPPTSKSSLLQFVFVGHDGLRGGWSLILFLLLTVVLGKATTPLFSVLRLPGYAGQIPHPDASTLDALEVITTRFNIFLDLVIATWIMSRIERRSLESYGSGGPDKVWRFFAGCLSGLICFAALAGCLRGMGFLAFDGVLLRGSAILNWGLLWAVAFLMVALAEETSVRAYMQFTLARGLAGMYGSWFKAKHRLVLGFWTAAILLGCLFISNHSGNPGESRLGLVQLGLFALLMCFSFWRTGSLWWAIGFHAAFGWAEAFLFGVADSGWGIKGHLLGSHPMGNALLSGGSAGAEGSVLATTAWALGVVLLFWTTSSSPWPVAGLSSEPTPGS
jgi:membrane protease YdiL (CAAX protease family)